MLEGDIAKETDMRRPMVLLFAAIWATSACTTAPLPVQKTAPVLMPENVCKLRGCVETADVSAQLRNLGELVYFYTPEIGSICWAAQLTLFVTSFPGEVPQADLEHLDCRWNLQGVIPPATSIERAYTA